MNNTKFRFQVGDPVKTKNNAMGVILSIENAPHKVRVGYGCEKFEDISPEKLRKMREHKITIPKVIVHIRGGMVQAVHSSMPLEYVVIDCDEVNESGLPDISAPSEPDTIDADLLIKTLGINKFDQAAEKNDHPWK